MRFKLIIIGVFFRVLSFAQIAYDLDHYKKGVNLYKKGEYAKAIVEFDLSILKNPRDSRAFYWRGASKSDLKLYSEAIEDFSKAISMNSRDTMAIVGRGNSYLFQRKLELAMDDFQRAKHLDSTNQAVILGIAQCYSGFKNYKKSIAEFTKFLKANTEMSKSLKADKKSFNMIYMYRAEDLYRDGQFKLALDDYNRYINAGGDFPSAFYYRGVCFFRLNKPDSAINDLSYYLKSHDKVLAVYKFLGGAYAMKDDSVNARKYFNKALQLNPEAIETMYYYAVVEENFRNYRKASELLYKVMPHVNPVTNQNLLVFGYASAGTRDTISAAKYFDEVVKNAPNDSSGYAARARLFYSGTKYSELVLGDLEKLLGLFQSCEKQALAKAAIGFYLFKQNDLVSSRKVIEEAIGICPNSVQAKISKATVEFISDHLEGTKLFESIVKDNPKSKSAILFLAHAQKINGNFSQACKIISNAKSNGVDIQEKAARGICSKKLVESNNDIVALFESLVKDELVAK